VLTFLSSRKKISGFGRVRLKTKKNRRALLTMSPKSMTPTMSVGSEQALSYRPFLASDPIELVTARSVVLGKL